MGLMPSATPLKPASTSGCVYLVGSGPGDPELLTRKAWRLMQSADLVVYDRLVSDAILKELPPSTELIYVGKKEGFHCVPQNQINELLINKALSGRTVLRLKGGDPYIFGRGGEEAETLIEAGIDFEVVPGITSAAGAASYCGIPLTHRDYAHSVTFITGHLRDGKPTIDWQQYIHPQQTLVVYMGLNALQSLCEQLCRETDCPDLPIAVIHRATQPQQQMVCGTLSNIYQRVCEAGLQSPSIIIIGEVVKLHNVLHATTHLPEMAIA